MKHFQYWWRQMEKDLMRYAMSYAPDNFMDNSQCKWCYMLAYISSMLKYDLLNLVLSLYPCFLSFQNVESYVSKSYVLSYVLKITMHELIQTQFLIHSPLGNLTSVLTKTLLA